MRRTARAARRCLRRWSAALPPHQPRTRGRRRACSAGLAPLAAAATAIAIWVVVPDRPITPVEPAPAHDLAAPAPATAGTWNRSDPEPNRGTPNQPEPGTREPEPRHPAPRTRNRRRRLAPQFARRTEARARVAAGAGSCARRGAPRRRGGTAASRRSATCAPPAARRHRRQLRRPPARSAACRLQQPRSPQTPPRQRSDRLSPARRWRRANRSLPRIR